MKLDVLRRLNAARDQRMATILVTDPATGEARLVVEAEGYADDPLRDELAARFRSGSSGMVEVEGRSLFLTLMVARYLKVDSNLDLLKSIRPGVLVAIAPALAAGSLDWLMAAEGVPAWLRLVVVGVVAAVVTVGAFLAMRGLLSTPLQSRLGSLLPRMAHAKG